MLLFVPVSFLSGVFAGRSNFGVVNFKGISAVEEGGRITIETVENIRTVVSLGRENFFIQQMKDTFNKGSKGIYLSYQAQAVFYSISNTLLFFIQMTAFSYGWSLMKSDGLKTADLFKVYAVMTFSSMLLGRIYAQLPDQKKARDSTKTAFEIIERTSKIDSLSNDGIKLDNVVGNIEFKNVDFEYSTRPGIKILNNFNLSIKNGQSNALVGSSGCGKSTTIALLLRFYDVANGSVLLDGVDIRELNLQWLRSQIGIVSQEPVLYDCTIRENICNGDLTRDNVMMPNFRLYYYIILVYLQFFFF
jgi:ABC-type bacteriocin/lantibiotic exporter with double-glycine peptidase domain